MNGLLSQSIANLVVAEQQFTFLSGLPSAAQQIQSKASAVITNLIPQIQTMQRAVSDFVQTAIPQLNNIQMMVSNNQSLPQIKADVVTVQSEMSSLKSTVDGLLVQLNLASSPLHEYVPQLYSIKFGLTVQVQVLKWKSDVNDDYQSQISSLNAQINSLNTLQATCQQVAIDFQGVMRKTTEVQDSVNLLVSELSTMSSDLNEGEPLMIIKCFVMAAIPEVQALGVDAS